MVTATHIKKMAKNRLSLAVGIWVASLAPIRVVSIDVVAIANNAVNKHNQGCIVVSSPLDNRAK